MTYADAVLHSSGLTTVQAMVAIAWAHGADSWMACRSYDAVARTAKVHRRTAIRATQQLVEAGWLRLVATAPHRPCTYALVVPQGDGPPPLPYDDPDVAEALAGSRDAARAAALHDDPAWRADRAEHPRLRALWAAWTADGEVLARER